MKTHDMWHKRAVRTNDKLHWNAYHFFRQEVKREIRLAEKEHVRSEILKSNGNSNSIWKILNCCIPRKNALLMTVKNPFLIANKFNKFYANVGKATALKVVNLAEEHNLDTQHMDRIDPCEINRSPVKIISPHLHFNLLLKTM